MNEWKSVSLPLTKDAIRSLRAGDRVLLSGPVLTGRDAAHKRLVSLLESGEPLPVNLTGETIYYVGPCPVNGSHPVGSAGPTTSARVDSLTPALLSAGLSGMIGKGNRSEEVVAAMQRETAVYFAAVGGAGALLAAHITGSEVLAFPDLGTEAIHRFILSDFPVIVAVDCEGRSIYPEDQRRTRP